MPAADPSTIFLSLPVNKPRDVASVEHPSYYPSYSGLSPEQRWVYLSWLCDIRQPVYIGYAFIYYYGLERHLVEGKYELAFEELLDLRQHHNHPSFQSYSRVSMICSSLIHGRSGNLARLYSEPSLPTYVDNCDLLVAHQARMPLSVPGLVGVARCIPTVNKRYIKLQPDLFEKMLSAVLLEAFGEEQFPFFSFYGLSDLPKTTSIVFSNISFPPQVRSQDIPDFFAHRPFVKDVSELISNAHERTKETLAQQRKHRAK